MAEQAFAFLILIGLIFALNVIPVFAPPTWMALAFVGFQFPQTNPWALALLGAGAATLGRLTLALLSHKIVGKKLLSKVQRSNIDAIKQRLQKRTTLTFGIFLSYAFSPLPSNFLFIAYGLTALPLARVIMPFFLGRCVSYAFFIVSGQAVGRRFQIDSLESTLYASGYFIVTQLVVIAALYIFTHIDWAKLIDDHRLVWSR
jgi:membrane protein YqaA with SNARE-associated domain